MTESQGNTPTADKPKSGAGRKKMDKKKVVEQIGTALFGPRNLPSIKIDAEIKGDFVSIIERGFLVYQEACVSHDRKPDVGEFLTLALEPGLRQVFKYQIADAAAAHDVAKRFFEEGISKKKSGSPAGEPVVE